MGSKLPETYTTFEWNNVLYVASSNISISFLNLDERRFLFSSANVTFNETLIETLNAYLNACLNERPHEEGYYDMTVIT